MTKAAPETDGGDDLAILFPERLATIAGVAVTMREYRWVEGLRLQLLTGPIVAKLADLAEQDRLMEAASLELLFAEQGDALPTLIATACDQPVAWVETLSDQDGRNLRLLWWVVNLPFFVTRVSEHLVERQLNRLDGQMSSPSSSALDMTRNDLASTRVVN